VISHLLVEALENLGMRYPAVPDGLAGIEID